MNRNDQNTTRRQPQVAPQSEIRNPKPALSVAEGSKIQNQRNLVTFRLDRQTYALPIEPVQQIIEMVTITPIPQLNHSIQGVINFHGAAVPVVDLRRHLGLPQSPFQLHTPIILTQISTRNSKPETQNPEPETRNPKPKTRKVGLIVDEVLDVLNLPASQVIRPADILPEELDKAPLLQGLVHTQAGTVLLLDPGHLFTPQQARALAQAAAALSGGVANTPLPPSPCPLLDGEREAGGIPTKLRNQPEFALEPELTMGDGGEA